MHVWSLHHHTEITNAHTSTSHSPDTASQMDANVCLLCSYAEITAVVRALFGMDDAHQLLLVICAAAAVVGKFEDTAHGCALAFLACCASDSKPRAPSVTSDASYGVFLWPPFWPTAVCTFPCSLSFGGQSNTPTHPHRPLPFSGIRERGHMSTSLSASRIYGPTCLLCCDVSYSWLSRVLSLVLLLCWLSRYVGPVVPRWV